MELRALKKLQTTNASNSNGAQDLYIPPTS